MADVPGIALALAVGLVLGLLYFGGLWLTLQRLPGLRHPGAFALASFAGRTAVVVAAILLVAGGRWQRVAAFLVGFLVARSVLIRRLRPRRPAAPEDAQ